MVSYKCWRRRKEVAATRQEIGENKGRESIQLEEQATWVSVMSNLTLSTRDVSNLQTCEDFPNISEECSEFV